MFTPITSLEYGIFSLEFNFLWLNTVGFYPLTLFGEKVNVVLQKIILWLHVMADALFKCSSSICLLSAFKTYGSFRWILLEGGGQNRGNSSFPGGVNAPFEGRRQKGATHQGFIDQMESDVILLTECFSAHPESDK